MLGGAARGWREPLAFLNEEGDRSGGECGRPGVTGLGWEPGESSHVEGSDGGARLPDSAVDLSQGAA